MMWFWACELARPRVHHRHRLLFPSFLHFEPLRGLCGKPDAQHHHNKDTQPSLPTDSLRLNVVVGVSLPRLPFQKHSLADLAEALPRSMGTHQEPLQHDAQHHKDHATHSHTNSTPLHHTHTQASVAALALRLPSLPPAHETQTHHPPTAAVARFYIPQHIASSNPRPRLEPPPR